MAVIKGMEKTECEACRFLILGYKRYYCTAQREPNGRMHRIPFGFVGGGWTDPSCPVTDEKNLNRNLNRG